MVYTTYLRWALLGGLSLVLVIPFIIADGVVLPAMFFPFITAKNFIFRILVEILLGLYILLALREPSYRPRASWLLWALTAFVVWVGIATLFSADPIKSFWSNFERMEGYLTLLHLFAYFLVAGAVLTTEKWWTRFFNLSIGASVLMGFYALLQLFGVLAISSQSGPRVDTTFGNATYLAVYMLLNIFITLFMLARTPKENRMMQAVYGIALVLQFTALFFTETRGALLGVIGGLIIGALYIAWRASAPEWKVLRKWSFGILGGIALLIVGFLSVRNTEFIQNAPGLSRLASISLEDRTTQARLFYIWPMAFKGFIERPITGWGQESFNYIFNKHYDPALYSQETWFDRAHNQFLDWLVAAGLPGFLLYLSFFLLAAWIFFRSDKLSVPEGAALLGLLAAYAFNNLFVFDNLVSALYFFTLLAFAHGLSRRELPGFLFLSRPMGDRAVAIAAPIVLVLVVGGIWSVNAAPLSRAQALIFAIQTGGDKDPEINLAEFRDALSRGPLGKQETVEQLLQFASNSVAPSSSISPEVRQQAFELGKQAGEEMLQEHKDDARLELFFGVFFTQFGQYGDALAHLERARALSPRKQQILMQTGLALLQSGNPSLALPPLQEAFDSAPGFKDARIFYAIGLYYAGESAQADELLRDGFGTTVVDDNRLLQTYINLKLYDRVVGIWALRVENDPQNVQLHVGLAAAYFAAGDNAKAIDELQKAITLNPALASQIQAIINQIKDGTLPRP